MSVKRRLNVISQQRVDVPDFRSLESAASNDFDELVKTIFFGEDEGYILRGFDISSASPWGAASGLLLLVDSAAVLHTRSSQSGTFMVVPSGTSPEVLNSSTNTLVDGSFTPGALNYVGLEYERYLDPSTSSQVYLWDSSTDTETTTVAPRAQILRYRVKITTSVWAANVLPLAIVETDVSNNVVSVEDRRRLLFRLGTAGRSTPDPLYQYPWTAQSEGRIENPYVSTSNTTNPFHGGDKMLGTFKDFIDAVMTTIQEIKGTPFWFSPGSAGSISSLREDLGNTVVVGRGQISHSKTVAGRINWNQDIYLRTIGSRLSYKIAANASSTDITLTDDKVAYLNLVRGVDVVPELTFTQTSAVVTSVGAVSWTSSLLANDWVKLGSETNAKYYQILSVDTVSQVTLTEPYAEVTTTAPAKYAFGTYQTSPTPSTNRHIWIADRKSVPAGADVFWLMVRSDNSGTLPRVYIRFIGSELEQGEDKEISDDIPLEVLQYIGSAIETSYLPQYVAAYETYTGSVAVVVKHVCQATTGSAATMASGQYFYIYSSGNNRVCAIWVNKDASLTDPPIVPLATDYIEWPILTGDSADDTASKLAIALTDVLPNKDFTATALTNVVTITNNAAGATNDPSNATVGAPFAIITTVVGVGTGSFAVNDGDDLTLAIKKLDFALGGLSGALDTPGYDATIDIVASGATPPTSLNGPVLSGTTIDLPDNIRLGGATQYYTVGNGILQISLNGQRLISQSDGGAVIDWAEVGATGIQSNQIQILQDLAVGDVLKFEIIAVGGSGSGSGGGIGPAGPQGIPGVNEASGPIAVSTKTSSYPVALSDNALLADCTSGAVTFTLPLASTGVGRIWYFKKIDVSGFAMIIQTSGSDTLDGLGSKSTTTQYESFTVVSDGTSYWIL